MIDGNFKCLIFPSCWRASYIWIKEAINLCSATLAPPFFFYWDLTWRRKKADEEMMMNHSSCGTAPIKCNLHFHAIIRLSWCFQITFRTTLILSPQTSKCRESNHENSNSTSNFCLAFWRPRMASSSTAKAWEVTVLSLSYNLCSLQDVKIVVWHFLVHIKFWNIIFFVMYGCMCW